MVGAAIAVSLSAAVLLASTGAAPAQAETYRHKMLRLTNLSRLGYGLRALVLNRRLSAIARQHSRRMADERRLFHSEDMARKLSPWQWSAWGENLGSTFGTLGTLERAFMTSAEHRTNILYPGFRRAGVGVVKRRGAFWVTVIFYG